MIGLRPSTYYYKPKKSRTEKEREDADLCEKIETLQLNYSCWGYRTLKAQFRHQYGLRINNKKILRIMRKYRLFRPRKRRFSISTTDSNHPFRIYPNLVKGKTVTAINQVWVADLTYIRILTGFVYLAVILDIYSRKVIGWALSKSLEHTITVKALTMALAVRQPGSGLIHHSDRGVQYACNEYIQLLDAQGIYISMSAKGNPYQNAYAESFFKTLKNEEVYLWEYKNFIDVAERIPEFIEEVYNKKRVHSGINYLTPESFEIIIQDKDNAGGLGQYTLNL